MDQLHEELKQPLPPLAEDSASSESDDDEPNHHNKRLLGGTSLSYGENVHKGIVVTAGILTSGFTPWLF